MPLLYWTLRLFDGSFDDDLVERQTLVLGWHALRLCEGRGELR